MKISIRKAFTLVEMLIAIAIIAVLSAMLIFGIDEFNASARARTIVTNLHIMNKAINAWYVTHSSMVVRGKGGNYGIMYNKTFYPIQELWEERGNKATTDYDSNPIGTNKKILGVKSFIARYMENPDSVKVSGTNVKTDKNFYSPMIEGGYMIHDDDTEANSGAGATRRTAWYVGFTIPKTSQYEKVKQKLAGMAKSQGLLQRNRKGFSDNSYKDGEQVWMMAIDFEN